MDVHAHSTSKSNMCFCNVCDPEGEQQQLQTALHCIT